MQATSTDTPDISIVSPVYGCAGCLEDLVERTRASLQNSGKSFEIILVDDASPDQAWGRIVELAAHDPAVRGLRLSRNFGQHPAISAGLREARGNVVVVMDCDLQDMPEEIPALLAAIDDGADIALAMRIDRQDSWLKRQGSRLFYAGLGWLTDSNYDHTTANFGAYTRNVVDAINAMPEADRFFPLLVRWVGFNTRKVAVTHAKREVGKSTYSLRSLLRLATQVVLSFSDKPLRLLVKAGMLFCVLAFAVVAFAVKSYFEGEINVAGYTSIIASMWLIGGIIIISLGFTGLYIGRIFNQVKGRPSHIIATRVGGNAKVG